MAYANEHAANLYIAQISLLCWPGRTWSEDNLYHGWYSYVNLNHVEENDERFKRTFKRMYEQLGQPESYDKERNEWLWRLAPERVVRLRRSSTAEEIFLVNLGE